MFSHILLKNKLTPDAVGEESKNATHIYGKPPRLFQKILWVKKENSPLIFDFFMFNPTILKCILKPAGNTFITFLKRKRNRLKIKAIYAILINLLKLILAHILLYLVWCIIFIHLFRGKIFCGKFLKNQWMLSYGNIQFYSVLTSLQLNMVHFFFFNYNKLYF